MAEAQGQSSANYTRPMLRQGCVHSNPVLQSTKITSAGTDFYQYRKKKQNKWHQPRPPDNKIEKSNRLSAQRRNINDHLLLTENKDLKIDQLWKPPLTRLNSRSRSKTSRHYMYIKENPGPRSF